MAGPVVVWRCPICMALSTRESNAHVRYVAREPNASTTLNTFFDSVPCGPMVKGFWIAAEAEAA